MSATVKQVRVEEGFVKASFAGLDLIITEQIGFINATQLCHVKGKKLARYNEPQARKNLKLVLTSYYGDLTNKVNPNVNHDPCLAGTYFHPALLLDLATWLSPETYVHSAIIINSFFNQTDQRKWQFRMLFACEEIATYENDPPNCRIRYESLDLLVNANAWFKSSDFCCANGKKVRDFEARKDVASLLEYFRTRGLFHGTHYHPLLFLRLAAWVNIDFYVKCARVVFCCNDVRLNALFRREIAAAGASPSVGSAVGPDRSTNGIAAAGALSSVSSAVVPERSRTKRNAAASASSSVTSALAPVPLTTNGIMPASTSSSVKSAVAPIQSTTNEIAAASTSSSVRSAEAPIELTTNGIAAASASSSVRSTVAPNRSMTNGRESPAELSAPSTSSGQAALPKPNLESVIWINKDEDSEDSNMTLDMNNEEDQMLTRKEHEVELARVRRELERVVEHERIEKEAALAREQEKEMALTRVQEEKRAAVERARLKEDQVEALRRQLEDLEISDSRMTLRKRSHAESRASAAATIMNDVGVAGLECLVLFVSTKNAVYGYRRQFQNIIPAIYKQLDKVAMFVGWFITNNAVLDYNRCKTLVSEKARECGRNVRVTQNQMELDNEDGVKFDLPDTICSTLRIDLEVIEADVKILGRLFKRPTYRDNDAVPADPQKGESSSAFLARVHGWIEKEHASFMSIVERRLQRRNQSARR